MMVPEEEEIDELQCDIENRLNSRNNPNNTIDDVAAPLNCHRDPRRSPLHSRMIFGPAPSNSNPTNKSLKGASRTKKEVTPAYAFRHADTGLLEIRTGKPPSRSMVAHEDDSVVGLDPEEKQDETRLALYPIALNGGGAGLYRDPREFAADNIGGFSRNHRTEASRRAPLDGHVHFAYPCERNVSSSRQAGRSDHTIDLEAGESTNQSEVGTNFTRRSLGALSSVMNPWKVWENVHNEMSRLAALRTQRAEEEASHVTLARQRNKATRVSDVYNDDDFDFALVLAPHDAYAFWANHLDFREEALNLVDDSDPNNIDTSEKDDDSTIATNTFHANQMDDRRNSDISAMERTPPTNGSGLRRRTNATPSTNDSKLKRFSSVKKLTPPSLRKSPFRVRTGETPGSRVFSQRKSIFERRFSPTRTGSSRRMTRSSMMNDDTSPAPSSDNKRTSASPYAPRRRWGNAYDNNKLSTPNLTSPPIVSLKKGSAMKKRQGSNVAPWRMQRSSTRLGLRNNLAAVSSSLMNSNKKRTREKEEDKTDDNDDQDDFFSSPGIPRGIAARVHGLDKFLEALKIGIVVRRHWPNGKSVFIQLYSDDGGDTIEYKYMPDDEAVIALKEQEQRYNGRRKKKKARVSLGERDSRRTSRDSQTTNQTEKHHSVVPLPDYLKAKIDREEDIRKNAGIRNAVSHSTLTWQNAGKLEAREIVQLHPANSIDPFSISKGETNPKLGTASLRRSGTPYVKANTFSIISPSMQGKFVQERFSSVDLNKKWCDGENPSLFRSLDIEMYTEGEYWMVLKGFTLLHRDASNGRFAAMRAGGFGSYHRYANPISNNQKVFSEVLPPPNTRNGKDQVQQSDIIAPPSDYFLGFSSPGTQIWGRLRQAGLETQRLYALDTRKVMLKVRCPIDRLQDVAEALKLKLKTKSGEYVPFREDIISQFSPTDDGFVSREDDVDRVMSLFRSSERQKIIDFIIGSRIRDSGAELGPSTQLGKQIQRRVPLHSHARLEALYKRWVLFWYQSNWTGRSGKSLEVDGDAKNKSLIAKGEAETSDAGSSESSTSTNHVPSALYRFFVGCFYQPLDSIEEYYGEKIAFYFAWLQHCSFHLSYLSIVGLIVFICQVTSGKWDHPLRPAFSMFVMVWSFVVMVTWRRRSNFLAHQWGTLDYKEDEIARPGFRGTEHRVCPITDTYVEYYPPWKRWLKMCISIPLTVGFTFVTLLVILILYGNRDLVLAKYFSDQEFKITISTEAVGQTAPILAVELTQEHLHDPDFWLIIVGFPTVLGLILPLLNFILRRISLWLNEIENHRTEAEFRTHFIIKVFAFRFVCYFAALYYYSFIGVGENDPQATEQGIVRVASTLLTYITVAHWWNICIQVFFPLLLFRWRVYRERLHLQNELRQLEMLELQLSSSTEKIKSAEERLEIKKQLLNRRLLLEHAQVNIWEEMLLPEHDSFTEYLFAVTHFAYVACFSVVLPITPLIVLINHLLSMRLDAFKLCRGRRRPLSQKTGGIGVWGHVLHIVTVIAILTNCSLMAFTSSQFNGLKEKIGILGVFALAIGWEHFMLLVKYIMQLTVSVMPSKVEIEMNRKKYHQERDRYLTLRAKKERRSASLGGEKASLMKDHNHSDESDASSNTIDCPPIKESSTESTHSSSAHTSEGQSLVTARSSLETENEDRDSIAEDTSTRGGLVNIRAMNYHRSPTLDQNAGRVQTLAAAMESSALFRDTEGVNENGLHAGKQSNPNSSLRRRGTPKQGLNDFNQNAPTTSWLQQEGVLSPGSSISTVQAMPTPRNLKLDNDSDDETLYADEDSSSGYYYNASAPPMSPPNDYSNALTVSNSKRYGYSSNTQASNVNVENEPPNRSSRSKWGVHHIFNYNQSERSLQPNDNKKEY